MRLEAAAKEGGSVCGKLRPGSSAMAGVLSRDAPDIEVPTVAQGWEGPRGEGGLGARQGQSGATREVSLGRHSRPNPTRRLGTRTWSLRKRLKGSHLSLL